MYYAAFTVCVSCLDWCQARVYAASDSLLLESSAGYETLHPFRTRRRLHTWSLHTCIRLKRTIQNMTNVPSEGMKPSVVQAHLPPKSSSSTPSTLL